MRRREFFKLLGNTAVAWPLSLGAAALAQSSQQARRVGVLLPFDENDPEAKNRLKQFRLGMRDLDWIEGRSWSRKSSGNGSTSLATLSLACRGPIDVQYDTAPFHDSYHRSFTAAPRPSVEVEIAHVRTADEIESTIAKLGKEQGSGLILGADNFIANRREPIIKLANERGVPTVSGFRQFVVDGCLMAYGPDTGDISRRASAYVDRILRGERPGNLPVQSPTRFELILNLKTAKALGLSVQESFLELCDEVIE